MHAARSEETSPGGSSLTCGKAVKRSGSKLSAEVTFPPLSGVDQARLSAPWAVRPPLGHATSGRPPSLPELPRLVARVEPGGAAADKKWTEGARLTAAASGSDAPVRESQSSVREEHKSKSVAACQKKKPLMGREGTFPLTGIQLVEFFGRERGPEDVEFYYLREADGDARRPYDLTVVDSSAAGPEHYVFSPTAVLHVTEQGCGGFTRLAEWHAESEKWTALQEMSFFRNFRLLKAFSWWHKNARSISFQRKCRNLQEMLLLSVPHFRSALLLFAGPIEELKATRRIPLDGSKTYTLLEFKKLLMRRNQELLQSLRKLSECRTTILNTVKNESYKTHQELQLHIKLAQSRNRSPEPMHLLLAHQQELKQELARSQGVLLKLGAFAALVHHMVVQSLVTVVQQDAVSFLDAVERMKSQQRCLFGAELCFAAGEELTVKPPVGLFQQAVGEALRSAGSSVVQMCESCGFFLEISSSDFSPPKALVCDSSCVKHTHITDEKSDAGRRGRLLRERSAQREVRLPEGVSLTVHGSRVHGCYSPLSKAQLEWHISRNDATERLEEEQAGILQEAEAEVRQLCERCSWLGDVRSFAGRWSGASLEAMKGQPASLYEELIRKIRSWTEMIDRLDSTVSTTNHLFIIRCNTAKETLGRQLKVIDEEVLEHLTVQVRLQSASFMSDLEATSDHLKSEPADLHAFSQFAHRVRESGNMLTDTQKRLDYILSLSDAVRLNYRRLTEPELAEREKMLGLWGFFIPLLKRAESVVRRRLPSLTAALDTMHSHSVDYIKSNVSDATSQPFLDPAQDAKRMLSKLESMCADLQSAGSKLEQLSRSSLDLRERPLDLTVLTTDVPKVVARKELWAIRAAYSTWLEEWNQQPLREANVSQAQEKLIKWKEQAECSSRRLPAHDAVLQETLGVLDSSSRQLAVLSELQSSTLTETHWEAVSQGLGLTYVPENKMTVGDVMSPELRTNEMLIEKICREAQRENNMKRAFQRLCRGWEDRLLQMEEFQLPAWRLCENQSGLRENEKATEGAFSDPPPVGQQSCNDARVRIVGLEVHFAEIENDLMILSTMFKSPHSVAFRPQLEHMAQSLEELEKLLDLFQRYQQMWAFMSKVFRETSFSDERADLMQLFLQVDETFRGIMQTVSSERHVWNFLSVKTEDSAHGNSLSHVLLAGLSTMEAISNQMTDLLDAVCHRCPRLWFLRDRNVMELLSSHSTPLALQRFVRRCFRGVQRLEVLHETQSNTNVETWESQRQMKVLGVFGSLQEHISFPNPLEPKPDALLWFSAFEKQLKLTMIQLMKQCAAVCEQLEPSSHDPTGDKAGKESPPSTADRSQKTQTVLAELSGFPLQCVLVAEGAAWCRAVVQAFHQSSPLKLNHLKALNSAKLRELGRTIRGGVTGSESGSLTSKYRMMCLHALVHLTMNQSQQLTRLMEVQIPLESSFEWLSLMKYSISSEDVSQEDGDHTTACHIDVFNHRLQYGFEYFGPEDLMIGFTPSSEKAMLGILLALADFRCGLVSGPRMSGKKTTAVHLGKALGRQVVVAHCFPNMTLSVIQQMLRGALQTGAFLLLDSVNLLTQGVLSALGQQLLSIHQSFSKLRGNQSSNEKPEDKPRNAQNREYLMEFAGKSISASPSYGCILISPQWCSSSIPNSLRFAMRPIALECPDHRVIAEVTLTSVGFSEAVSLSRRLVSLLSLATDSHSLPDFFITGRNGFLGVLQKIISASKMHLYQTMQRRERSNEAYFTAEACTSSKNMPESLKETDEKEIEKLSKLRKSHQSVVQGLLEETAIVKAILSVLIPEHNKDSQFYTIFRETFPIVCQFPYFQHFVEETEKIQLQDAVREELQRMHFQNDSEIISSTVTLYQALKVSPAVILVGASGSGKTTCHRALAGALNSLAAKSRGYVFENDETIEKAGQQISASSWSFVDSLVLFPNAMSHDELFGGFCERRGWRDGAVAKVLREQHDHTHPETDVQGTGRRDTPAAKWLVMDGEPSGQPSWLDHLTTLCSSQGPCLSLPSGETLAAQSNFKLLVEMTDLHRASPSTVTRCGLVFFTSVDLWKAVWKSEMDALAFEHNLDQGIMRMWNCLAEDLFHDTLCSPVQETFTSAIQMDRKDCSNPVCGIQEIMSFVRILRALLLHFRKDVEKPEEILQVDNQVEHIHGAKTPGTKSQSEQQLLTRDIFLVAYIWGFGGHLHPRHWAEFDTLVRKVLFACRYKIVVPENVTVFDYFFSMDAQMNSKNTMLTSWIIQKYEKYTYLMNLMLEANQPVLLVGEPNSGKSTLCKNLLTFDKPHVSLPASPLLTSRDIRTVLRSISRQKRCRDAVRPLDKQPNLLLFVDDLHEAPCGVFGKESIALETLRQSISKREIVVFDSGQFNRLSSETVGYMAACCASGLSHHHSNGIFSRLSRLFSIFVLPNTDVILPIRSHLNIWLKQIQPRHSGKDLSDRIVAATKSLYHAVREQLQSPTPKPHLIFSHHDIQKVFWGMCLHQSDNSKRECIQERQSSQSSTRPPPSVLNIVHLWMHECMRTFSDRLSSENEMQTLVSLIATTATTHYGNELVAETDPEESDGSASEAGPALHTPPTDTALSCQPTGQDSNRKGHTVTQSSHLSCSEETSPKSRPTPVQVDENVITGLVYGPELSEVHDYGCSWSYQEQDLDALLQELGALMDRKEEDEALKFHNDGSIRSRYIVHRQGATQLLHILRTLLIPGGHGVLMGSSRGAGRKTAVRLAAYLTGHHLIEVHAGNESQSHEILQEAGNLIRADEVKVIILVHEEISTPVREELLVAMSQRAYPALLPDNELRNLVSRAAAVNNSRRCLTNSWMLEKHLHRAHRNIHVMLLMPHITAGSSEMSNCTNQPATLQTQISKAVRLSCCVEVYQPWSHQTLVEVATQCFKMHQAVGEAWKAGLSVAAAGIHQSACRYASVLLNSQPFSPLTYLGLFAHFGSLYNLLHRRRQRKSDRLNTVLCHLDVLNDAAEQSKAHLISLQTKINDAQQQEKELLGVVDHQKTLCKEAREDCEFQANKLCHLKEQITSLQKLLNPVFVSGFSIAKCLSPSDLEEVRHYRDPPDGVVKVMDAICLLFNRPPGWNSARQLLGQPNFFQDLQFFDHHGLSGEQRQQLEQVVCSPHFVPESAADVSQACESLCRWLRAVHERCRLRRQQLLKQRLEEQVREAQGELYLATQREREASERLQQAELRLRLVEKELEEQALQLQEAQSVHTGLSTCAQRTQAHLHAWRAAAQEAELHSLTLAGDALTLAAIISYLGPFGPDVRQELLSKWKKLFLTGSIDVNPEDPRASLFRGSDAPPASPPSGFPIAVSAGLPLPLGQALGLEEWQLEDTPSAGLLVKLLLWGCRGAFVRRWPLLADAQQHLEIRAKSFLLTGEKAQLGEETESEVVVCGDDPELLDKLGRAAQRGLRVLVTHVERALASPDFLALLARPAGCFCPGSEEPPAFSLLLSSELPVKLLLREIHPSILAGVHVVDLSLSSEEIRELMLTQLLQSESSNLLTQRLRLLNYNQSLQEKLFAEEEALMDYILQCDTVLLEEPGFLPRVAVCQEVTESLLADVKQLREELEDLDRLLAAPRQLIGLAASLYQALQEVSRLSPAYGFPLPGFTETVLKAFSGQARPLVSYAARSRAAGLVSQMGNVMAARVLAQYRPRLFGRHAAVLKLLASLALLEHRRLCCEAERQAFLRGLQDVQDLPTEAKQSRQFSPDLPAWIPPQTHSELLCLESIPAFRGLAASLRASPWQWQQYLRFPSCTVVGTVPCRSHSHLALLQRALLWRTVLPGCLEGIADDLSACALCPFGRAAGAEGPHAGNPEALSEYLLQHGGPVVLALPDPEGTTQINVHPLRLINQLSGLAEAEVKSISFGELSDSKLVVSLLEEAGRDGHWLIFNDCHLLEHWDHEVVARLCQLISFSKEEKRLIHPRFRLWFITQETAPQSIPAAVRRCALTLTCDPPWDLTEELSCSLRQLLSISRPAGVTAGDTELLLRSAVFHSVLLQRQAWKCKRRDTISSWSQEDLLALADSLTSVVSLCRDKAKALQSTAVGLVHGGHATDAADSQTVASVAELCFNTALPLSGGGPHLLSEIISKSSCCDLSALLQTLGQRLGESGVSDAALLGFGPDVEAEISGVNSRSLNALLRASQCPPGPGGRSPPETGPPFGHARDRLQALQRLLAHWAGSGVTNAAAAAARSPLRDFLQAEWDDLIDLVSSLLLRLVRYPPTFSPRLNLADLSRLERRAELLGAYLWRRSTSDPPGAYRIAAFKNAGSFLVAVIRQAAQENRKCISDITLRFEVLHENTNPASLPLNAVDLCGLELRGASWDGQTGALQDAVSSRSCSLPLLRMTAEIRNAAHNAASCKSSYISDPCNIQAASGPSSAQLPVYHCPLYANEDGDGGNCGLADANIVTTVPLHARLSPALCSLRGVRLVSSL